MSRRKKKRKTPLFLRAWVLDRDRRRCQYCGDPYARTVDHLRPVSLGGGSDLGNLVACCQRCNTFKADLLPLEYFWAWGPVFDPGRWGPVGRPAPSVHPRLGELRA